MFVLAIPVAAYGFLIQAREGQVARKSFKSRILSNFATMLFFGFLAFMVIYMKRHHNQIFHIDTSALDKSKNALKNRPHRTGAAKYEPHFEWLVFWIALAGIIVSAAAMYVLYRRQKKRKSLTAGPEPNMTEDLITSMSDAIDDLEAEPDARRAVIAAYARMEGVLGRHGLRRKPSETPLEYLRRILLGLTGRADAVQRLTSLFEQAKFSRRDIDVSMKQDAIGALREIRDDMEATA